MCGRFLKGGAAQRLVARLPPPFYGEIVQPGLGEMVRNDLGLSRCLLSIAAKEFACASVQRLAAALEQTAVGRVLDQRVLEAIFGLRRSALDKQQVGVGKPIQ